MDEPRRHQDGRRDGLVERAVGGCTLALEQLLLEVRPSLLAYLERKLPVSLRSVVSAEDIAQEALIEACRRIHTFKPTDPQAFDRWITTIARNRLVDLLRAFGAAKRGGGRVVVGSQGCVDDSVMLLLEAAVVDEHTPSRSAIRRETLEQLARAMAQLSHDRREVLERRYFKDQPVDDVARAMNRSPAAVLMLCSRAIRELRGLMEPTDG